MWAATHCGRTQVALLSARPHEFARSNEVIAMKLVIRLGTLGIAVSVTAAPCGRTSSLNGPRTLEGFPRTADSGIGLLQHVRQKGVPTRLVYFPDENHRILKPNNSLVWHKVVFGWLDRYIGRGATK